jgi:hypothetical protein
MSGFERNLRRQQLRRLALADALGRGCTCSAPDVRLLRVGGTVSTAAIEHESGCPASGSESVVVVPTQPEDDAA